MHRQLCRVSTIIVIYNCINYWCYGMTYNLNYKLLEVVDGLTAKLALWIRTFDSITVHCDCAWLNNTLQFCIMLTHLWLWFGCVLTKQRIKYSTNDIAVIRRSYLLYYDPVDPNHKTVFRIIKICVSVSRSTSIYTLL